MCKSKDKYSTQLPSSTPPAQCADELKRLQRRQFKYPTRSEMT